MSWEWDSELRDQDPKEEEVKLCLQAIVKLKTVKELQQAFMKVANYSQRKRMMEGAHSKQRQKGNPPTHTNTEQIFNKNLY